MDQGGSERKDALVHVDHRRRRLCPRVQLVAVAPLVLIG